MNSPNRNLAIIKAVREQHQPVARVATRFNVSRQWVYALLRRYDTGGPQAVKPKSKAPHSNPRAVSKKLKKTIINMRKQLDHSGLDSGAETIQFHLEQQGMYAPSTSTIVRILRDHGLVQPEPKKRPRTSFIRFEASRPNECWQADITHAYLTGGRRVEILDFIDDHSRLLLSITASRSFSGPAVADELSHLISDFGPPQSTLTDNGLVFTARNAGAKGGRNAFEKLIRNHRIQQKNGRPGHPQTQGKIERFHQTLKRWLSRQPTVNTIDELQQQLDRFAAYYNTNRPHRALGRRTPYEVYNASTKASPDDNPTDEWRTRNDKVDKAGRCTIRYAGRLYHLGMGRKYTGHHVLMIIKDRHITTSLKDTGAIITEHYIDISRNYQAPIWKHGEPPLN